MHLKTCAGWFLTLGALLITGCSRDLSGGTISSTTIVETSDNATIHLTDTPTSSVTLLPPTDTPEPSPTTLPNFQLPKGIDPGWLRAFDPEEAQVARFAFTSDSETLALSSAKAQIEFFSMTSGEQLNTLSYEPGATVGITDLVLSSDGMRLIVASRGRIDVWDISTKTFETLIEDRKYFQLGTYQSIELSPDGSFLAVGPTYEPTQATNNNGGLVRYVELWETKTWTRHQKLEAALPSYSFSPDGQLLVTLSGASFTESGGPSSPVVWNILTGARYELTVDGYPMKPAFSPDGETLAINTWEYPSATGGGSGITGTLLLDVEKQQVRHTINFDIAPEDLAFSPDGRLLAVLYGDQIVLWDAQTSDRVLDLKHSGSVLRELTFSPDGKFLAAISSDGRMLFWNIPTH